MKTRTGERRLFLDTICLKCQGSWERGGGQRVTKQETINSYLRALPCSDPSPSSQLLIDQLVDTCPVQPGCLPTSTDQPRESKNSRKCGWTFLEDSTFFKIWKAQQASVMRGIHKHIKKKTHTQKLMSFDTFDKSRPSSEWIWEYMTTVKMRVLELVGWTGWPLSVSP